MITAPQQMDFGSLLFPGRTMLYVGEVAERLSITQQQVHDLIASGDLGAIDIGNGTRRHWRIPVVEYEKFLKRRNSYVTV